MTIYKVVNDKNKTVVGFYLQYNKAMLCIKELRAWFTEGFHIEPEVVQILPS